MTLSAWAYVPERVACWSLGRYLVLKSGSLAITVRMSRISFTPHVPLLALDGLVESPVNPFTGKKLTDDTKNDPVHYVINSEYWNVDENNGNTFRSAIWLALEGKNAYDSSKWPVNSADSVMPVRTK